MGQVTPPDLSPAAWAALVGATLGPDRDFDGPICRRCQRHFTVHDGLDPTVFCDLCAQELMDEAVPALVGLVGELAEALGRIDRISKAQNGALRFRMEIRKITDASLARIPAALRREGK